jgi:succinate-semialdehyde dehydrogenase/glutarate-semialdehyde dehydrogenase
MGSLRSTAEQGDAMAIATTNPATGETLRSFEPLSKDEIDQRIGRAAQAFESYRLTTLHERAAWMRAAADVLDDDRDVVARTMTTEMGKTIGAARAEVEKCAKACRFFADKAPGYLADEAVDPESVGARQAFVRFQPIGPVLAVMPWNFPLWQAMRFAAPALMAGNVGLLKHASNVPQTALYMEELFGRAGFPPGTFQTLLIGADQVEQVLRDKRVRAATLTGSTPAGRSVASIAGDEIKKTVLELGGSDPFVVMPSADVARASETAVTARVQNNGQSCIAAKRFIVHDAIADDFEQRFVERMRALTVGDPMDESTQVGPLALKQVRDDVHALVADAVAKGARVLCGGEVPEGPGWYYPPTVVTGVTAEMDLFHEEAFGPVAQLARVSSIDEAIALANATDFGLGSNAWTNDREERDRFIRDLDAGQVFINGMVTSHPALPFGGVKTSGYGRELSAHGIREFCNAKAVWVGED